MPIFWATKLQNPDLDTEPEPKIFQIVTGSELNSYSSTTLIFSDSIEIINYR
jgi:hypothetical protein